MTEKLEQLEVVYQQWVSGIPEFCQTFYVGQGLSRHFSNRSTQTKGGAGRDRKTT